MKPHCMFFDESYNECYYRDMTTRKMEEKMDAFIVIGTALATGGAARMVNRTLEKMEVPIFEFNMNPCVDVGYTFNITEKCETALDKFFNEFYRLMAGCAPGKASLSVSI
jgi:NAD-dependent SIR2 family protein deacetylase